ncbi:MAG: ATP synthase F0 subunit C [Oscillibacter sp.]
MRADGPGAGRRGRRSGRGARRTDGERGRAPRARRRTPPKVRKIWAVAALIGVACFGGALGMAHSVAKAANNMAEQPEAAEQIRTSMMMGLVFIETVIIYALIVAILIIFVL